MKVVKEYEAPLIDSSMKQFEKMDSDQDDNMKNESNDQ